MLFNSITTQAIENLLTEPDTLSVLDFKHTKSIADCVTPTPAELTSYHEVWKVDDQPVTQVTIGNCICRYSEQFQFTIITTEVKPSSSYGDTTETVYLELLDVIQQSPHKNLIRFWNHIPDINSGKGDLENYKLFCSGRLKAFEKHNLDKSHFPAASAVGHHSNTMMVCALTTNLLPEHHTNPRQVDAFKYPRQYGPNSPSFARATTLNLENQQLCFISGTASILGHNSVHKDDLALQLYTTNDNILYLLKETGFTRKSIKVLRIYVRHWKNYEQCKNIINELFPTVTTIYTHADVCRSELLVEIECFCSSS